MQFALWFWQIAKRKRSDMKTFSQPQAKPVEMKVFVMLTQWFGWTIKNELDYSHLARSGVNPAVLQELLEHGYNKEELSWVIPPRTLSHRLQKTENLTRDESAKAIRVAKLTAQAEAVFGDPNKAHRWLSKPKEQLSGFSPKEAMQDEFGANLVDQLLKRIDSGYF